METRPGWNQDACIFRPVARAQSGGVLSLTNKADCYACAEKKISRVRPRAHALAG